MKDASVRRPPQIVRAALDGAVATAVMSVPMLLRWLLQPDQPPPPKVVAENVQRRIGIAPEQRSPLVRQATWLAAHVLFGGALGIAGARWPSATPRRFALTYG